MEAKTKLIYAALLGQLLAFLNAVTAASSQALSDQGVHLPTTQSALNYLLLASVYGGLWLHRGQPFRAKWYRYAALSLMDVEGTFCLVKAYEYTSITSVTLLDCFAIPGVLLLSWVVLGARYRRTHFVGAAICVGGLALLVLTDTKEPGSSTQYPKAPIGDALTLLGAALYACCNVGQEQLLGDVDQIEMLAGMSGFAAVWSCIQLLLVERTAIASVRLTWKVVGPWLSFVAALFTFSSLVPTVLQWGGATVFNLSLLSSDLWAALARVIFFGGFRGASAPAFFLSLVLVAGGIVLYSCSGDAYAEKAAACQTYARVQDVEGGSGESSLDSASVELSVSSRVAAEEEEDQELLVYAVVDEGEKSESKTEGGQPKPQTQAGTEP